MLRQELLVTGTVVGQVSGYYRESSCTSDNTSSMAADVALLVVVNAVVKTIAANGFLGSRFLRWDRQA